MFFERNSDIKDFFFLRDVSRKLNSTKVRFQNEFAHIIVIMQLFVFAYCSENEKYGDIFLVRIHSGNIGDLSHSIYGSNFLSAPTMSRADDGKVAADIAIAIYTDSIDLILRLFEIIHDAAYINCYRQRSID